VKEELIKITSAGKKDKKKKIFQATTVHAPKKAVAPAAPIVQKTVVAAPAPEPIDQAPAPEAPVQHQTAKIQAIKPQHKAAAAPAQNKTAAQEKKTTVAEILQKL